VVTADAAALAGAVWGARLCRVGRQAGVL